MSTKDKIILLGALFIIVGGALIINGRFNAELGSSREEEKQRQSYANFQEQLEVEDIDTLKDARGAVKIIRKAVSKPEPEPDKQQNAEIAQETKPKQQPAERAIEKDANEAVRASVDVPTPSKTAPEVGETYTVKKGQTLTDIALAVYNDKENVLKNAKKIYQFNKDILPSMDRIKVGQKLRLPGESNQKTSKLQQFAETMKDKVEFMSSKYVPQKKGELYVVKKGDSLWKIAKSNLGEGEKYKEIIEANRDKLSKNTKLSPGMALIIPE